MMAGTREEYENGLLCSRGDLKTGDMTFEDLIAFIGMLDLWITHLNEKTTAKQFPVS